MDARFLNNLTEGDFGNGRLLRQSLVEGEFWTLAGGCYCVYRGEDAQEAIDYESIVALTCEKGLLEIPENVTHQAGGQYYYAARRVSGTGKSEQGTTAVVRLALDEEGKAIPARPNCVSGLQGQAANAGRMRVSWWYWPMGQEVRPGHFAVYGDNGSGSIDYENPLGLVEYRGANLYSYLSSPGQEGTRYRFSVRAVASAADGGGDDGNTASVEITGRIAGLGGIEDVGVSVKW